MASDHTERRNPDVGHERSDVHVLGVSAVMGLPGCAGPERAMARIIGLNEAAPCGTGSLLKVVPLSSEKKARLASVLLLSARKPTPLLGVPV